MLSFSKLALLGVAALAGTGGAAAIATAGGADASRATTVVTSRSETRQAPPAAPTLARVPSWLRRDYALFRASNPVTVPASVLSPGELSQFGLNRRLARRIPTASEPIYVVPGSRGVCLDAGPPSTCGDRSQLTRRGLLLLYSCVAGAGDATQVFALVPDSVTGLDVTTSDGRTVSTKPTHNVIAIATALAPTAITWRGARDHTVAIDQAGGC